MRYTEFNEARKTPEQNPKTSINDIIVKAEQNTTSEIAGTTNLFVSFTTVDKLGINPTSEYKTPIGIYAYPAEYVIAETEPAQASMDTLPFAGDSPYVNLFNASGNIINVATMLDDDVKFYYRKIAELWANTSKQDRKTAIDRIEQYINEADTKAKFPEFPGGRLWYVTMMAAKELFSKAWNTTTPVAWNKLFRSIGVDGAIDFAKDIDGYGFGIIHDNEPAQAVFFAITAVKNVKRHNNKYSPAAGMLDTFKQHWQERHEKVSKVGAELKKLKTPEEIYNYLRSVGLDFVRQVKDPEARAYIIKKHPSTIGYLSHPSVHDQYAALSTDFMAIFNIIKPDEQVVLRVLGEKPPPASFDLSQLAEKMPHAGEQIQLLTVNADPFVLQYFTKPTPKAVEFALKRVNQAPKWLMNMAKKLGVSLKGHDDPENTEYLKDLRNEQRLVQQTIEQTQADLKALQDEWETMYQSLPATTPGNPAPGYVAKLEKIYKEDIKDLEDKLTIEQYRLAKIQKAIQQYINEFNA